MHVGLCTHCSISLSRWSDYSGTRNPKARSTVAISRCARWKWGKNMSFVPADKRVGTGRTFGGPVILYSVSKMAWQFFPSRIIVLSQWNKAGVWVCMTCSPRSLAKRNAFTGTGHEGVCGHASRTTEDLQQRSVRLSGPMPGSMAAPRDKWLLPGWFYDRLLA
jgi:hypothetical protein